MIEGVGPPLATCCPRLPERGGGGGGEVEKGGEEGGGEGGEEGGEGEGGGGVSTQQPPLQPPLPPSLPLPGWGGGGGYSHPLKSSPLSHILDKYILIRKNTI